MGLIGRQIASSEHQFSPVQPNSKEEQNSLDSWEICFILQPVGIWRTSSRNDRLIRMAPERPNDHPNIFLFFPPRSSDIETMRLSTDHGCSHRVDGPGDKDQSQVGGSEMWCKSKRLPWCKSSWGPKSIPQLDWWRFQIGHVLFQGKVGDFSRKTLVRGEPFVRHCTWLCGTVHDTLQ